MKAYRISYNEHRYSDYSDKPVRRVRRAMAESAEAALAAVWAWRDTVAAEGIILPSGRRLYVGMVHTPGRERNAPAISGNLLDVLRRDEEIAPGRAQMRATLMVALLAALRAPIIVKPE